MVQRIIIQQAIRVSSGQEITITTDEGYRFTKYVGCLVSACQLNGIQRAQRVAINKRPGAIKYLRSGRHHQIFISRMRKKASPSSVACDAGSEPSRLRRAKSEKSSTVVI